MIGIVFKASADFGEKFAKLCNPADCHPPVSFPSPLLKKCSLFNDFPFLEEERGRKQGDDSLQGSVQFSSGFVGYGATKGYRA
ncbi:RING-box protein 2 [Trichonephila clavipes]|nr:RING-box protein 2 [Trichonephila clavipes]